MAGQVVVQMRVPKISLVIGLQAQIDNDLCRYYKYKRQEPQIQSSTTCIVSFMVVPSVQGMGGGSY